MSNRFAIFLQYFKNKMNAEVDFLHAGNHESFLQIDSMILDGDGQVFPEFLK